VFVGQLDPMSDIFVFKNIWNVLQYSLVPRGRHGFEGDGTILRVKKCFDPHVLPTWGHKTEHSYVSLL